MDSSVSWEQLLVLKVPLALMACEHHNVNREVKREFPDKQQFVQDLYVCGCNTAVIRI